MENVNYTEYLEFKQMGMTRGQIATAFDIPDWKLKKLIAKNGWGKPPTTISNESLFDEYSEEACYWAGFLAADGNVDCKKRVRLMLKYDDIIHLEKFKACLGSTHSVSSNTDKYNRCSFEFTSPHICEILELNYNIIPNKTDCLKFPKHIPDKYLRHYIRGYFDGDGSLCESFSNRNSVTASIYATFASGSKEFSMSLFEYLSKILSLGGHLQEFTDSIKWQLKYNTNDAKVLTKYMYDNSNVYLDRKYTLYLRLIVNNIRETR